MLKEILYDVSINIGTLFGADLLHLNWLNHVNGLFGWARATNSW